MTSACACGQEVTLTVTQLGTSAADGRIRAMLEAVHPAPACPAFLERGRLEIGGLALVEPEVAGPPPGKRGRA